MLTIFFLLLLFIVALRSFYLIERNSNWSEIKQGPPMRFELATLGACLLWMAVYRFGYNDAPVKFEFSVTATI